MARARSNKAVVKITVNLPEVMVTELRMLADEQGKTFTALLKEAISIRLYVEDAVTNGSKILVEHPDGRLKEIHFSWIIPSRKP